MKTFLWIGGVLGVAFIMFLLFAPTTEEAALNSTPTVGDLQSSSIKQDDIDLSAKPPLYIGDVNASVTLVEYGDFKCPSCNSFHHRAGSQIRDEYVNNGKVKIEFRNYPYLGPDSGRAARGAYCANEQGKFAEYHDNVYNYLWDNYYNVGDLAAESRDILTLELLEKIMDGTVGDPAGFRDCLESTTFNKSVDTDLGLANGDGVSGTPSFTVQGRKITGPSNFNTFKTLFDIELR